MSEEHGKIYQRMDKTDEKMNRLLGQNETMIEQNRELIGLLKKALWYLFLLAAFELGVITYGAIGKEGFNTVKSGMVKGETLQPPGLLAPSFWMVPPASACYRGGRLQADDADAGPSKTLRDTPPAFALSRFHG